MLARSLAVSARQAGRARLAAVSYTHLDVYKRQEQMRFCENVCLPFIATAGNRQTDQHRFHIGAGVENIEQLLIAAKIDKKGCPLTATAAPTAAPSVKQPSVERSQTFSME